MSQLYHQLWKKKGGREGEAEGRGVEKIGWARRCAPVSVGKGHRVPTPLAPADWFRPTAPLPPPSLASSPDLDLPLATP